jgi:cyclopropane fatty-acyl-phospholipid synthase-like methyltransferase
MTEPTQSGDSLQPPPYFDVLFSRLQNNDREAGLAFGRHVHWGYWDDPESADGTAEDYGRAAERLCRRVCDAGGLRDGLRVLDVGCGFGGTIASLNERFANLDMVGVNIDRRQLDRAAEFVRPCNGNRVKFVEADACKLPFPAASFDVILAVECIFHFGSRAAFFGEAERVLRRPGTLALSDFVPTEEAVPLLQAFNAGADTATRRTYGQIDILCSGRSYQRLAQDAGLDLERNESISVHTLPTYPFLRKDLLAWTDRDTAKSFDRATSQLEKACRAGLLHYSILSFQKSARPALAQAA